MNTNEENKIQDLQKKIEIQEVIDIGQEQTIRNQHNETEMLKFKVQSQENQIQSQGKEIQSQENVIKYQGNEIKQLRNEYKGKNFLTP